ncbi:COMM domain-containing protein 7 isoform X4 [Anguilla rostrata]|uniref:COMM domain-containing protein 7 isoform X4 n=1 Tax=Anguilla rostrata TaxID=7938 RepID=UPI0030CC89F5
MLQLQFTKDTLPDSISTDFQNLNKFSEQQFVSLTDIIFRFLVDPKEADRFLQQLSEFAAENGMSAGPLRNLVKSVLLVPHGALKKALNADQVKEDLVTLVESPLSCTVKIGRGTDSDGQSACGHGMEIRRNSGDPQCHNNLCKVMQVRQVTVSSWNHSICCLTHYTRIEI